MMRGARLTAVGGARESGGPSPSGFAPSGPSGEVVNPRSTGLISRASAAPDVPRSPRRRPLTIRSSVPRPPLPADSRGDRGTAKRGGFLSAVLCTVGGLLLATPALRAQQADVEAWAARLVDNAALGAGDLDGAVEEWLGMVAQEPGHPLAEGTLRLVGLMQERAADPTLVATRVISLPSTGLSPLAARQLEVMQGVIRATRLPVADRPEEAFPSFLKHGFVLGPLPPLGNPLAARDPSPQFGEPAFGKVHVGVDGDVRWLPYERLALSRAFEPALVYEPARGMALLAFVFDVPECGFAWIEIGQRRSGNALAPYAVSINGEPPIVVEHLHEDASPMERHFAALRTGRNRIVIKCALDSRPELALRVLDLQGRPWPGLEEVSALKAADAPLGEPACSPGDKRFVPPADTIAFLDGLAQRGPDSEALLGLLQFQEGREADGLAHVRAACDAAPGRPGLLALRARLTLDANYLPGSWKKGTARALAESVVATDPHRLDMALVLAGILADEDREEEAIALLTELGTALPEQAQTRLALADVYRRLNMDVSSENALLAAQSLAPASPAVLRALAQLYGRAGQATRSAELSLSAIRASGASGQALRQIADRFASLGLLDRAEALYREALARDPDRESRSDLGEFLAGTRRWDEADAIFADLAARYPRWARPCVQRADVARLRGDPANELLRLREALQREPSARVVRERVAALGGPDPVGEFFAANRLDLDALRAAYDASGSRDSVVKLVDHAVVMVFPDGGTETLTQDLYLARDLAGCETLGNMRPQGEVLRLATIKPDGTEYEPVGTGNYVMPNLKPGDFVVEVTRSSEQPPSDGVLRLGNWFFASVGEPFVRSSYVISVPESLPLKLVQRQYTGEHEVLDVGSAVVHRFAMHDQARVLPEPNAPPPPWFLPWVEFGMDADRAAVMAEMSASVLPGTKVTPEIREAADRVTAGLVGDTAKAQALHRFVNDTLDQRGWQDATGALLQREGNASFLYAALLEATGVPHELVWSRNVSPEADEEPDPAFLEGDYWSRNLLVLVQPGDGEPAWCDMNLKTMPYGRLFGDAPGAPSVALPSCRLLTLPAESPAERPGALIDIELDIAADGSAQASGELTWTAGYGFAVKEQFRELPDERRKQQMTGMAAWLLPGIDLGDYEMPGLDSADDALALHVSGTVPTFLDDDGTALVCRLPCPPLNLKGELAGGSGLRQLPYFLNEAMVQSATITMKLAPDLQVLGLPTGHVAEIHGGRYELQLTQPEPGTLEIRRAIALPPFAIPASQYAEFEAFCAQVDEAERGQLRFVRAAPPQDP
jgi:tetratricopeptide (TPR) repeat protein